MAGDSDGGALHREFERLKTLDDPRIPKAIAWYEGSGSLAVEGPIGVPLMEVVTRRKGDQVAMTPATLLDIAIELADTVKHAHHKGRHHGGLSPMSITLTADGSVRIWGYGPGPEGEVDLAWQAPERARGRTVSGATDLWGLGVTLAALVTGRVPWVGPDVAMEARRGDVRRLVDPLDKQWPALGRVVRKMCAEQPADRYLSIHPVRQALLALARKAPGTSNRRELAAYLGDEVPRDLPLPSPKESAPDVSSEPTPEPNLELSLGIAPVPPQTETADDTVEFVNESALTVADPTDRETVRDVLPDVAPVAALPPEPSPEVDASPESSSAAFSQASEPVAPTMVPVSDPGVVNDATGPVGIEGPAADPTGSSPGLDLMGPGSDDVDPEEPVASAGSEDEPDSAPVGLALPTDWMEQVDIFRVAPWMVGAMFVSLVLYWFFR
jgi:serine/threonine protein kinase